jgi:hypothetical protein
MIAPANRGDPDRAQRASLRRPALLSIRTISTESALQSAGYRRNIQWARCPAVLNQLQSIAIDPGTKRGRIELPIVRQSCPRRRCILSGRERALVRIGQEVSRQD